MAFFRFKFLVIAFARGDFRLSKESECGSECSQINRSFISTVAFLHGSGEPWQVELPHVSMPRNLSVLFLWGKSPSVPKHRELIISVTQREANR